MRKTRFHLQMINGKWHLCYKPPNTPLSFDEGLIEDSLIKWVKFKNITMARGLL